MAMQVVSAEHADQLIFPNICFLVTSQSTVRKSQSGLFFSSGHTGCACNFFFHFAVLQLSCQPLTLCLPSSFAWFLQPRHHTHRHCLSPARTSVQSVRQPLVRELFSQPNPNFLLGA